MSGSRNHLKDAWHGYVSRGAVKAKLKKSGADYEGLPVPSSLIHSCPALRDREEEFGLPSGPCYALAVDSLEETCLFVALPIDPLSDGRLSCVLDTGTILQSLTISDDPGERCIDIGVLNVLRLPVRIRQDRHDRDAVIPTPPFWLDVTPARDEAVELIRLPRYVKQPNPDPIFNLGLAEPYFSVFFDDRGLLLFFVEHPREEEQLPAPEGIVEAKGFEWVRRLQLKSLKNFTAADVEPIRKRLQAEGGESLDDSSRWQARPEHPRTMSDWLRDSSPPEKR